MDWMKTGGRKQVGRKLGARLELTKSRSVATTRSFWDRSCNGFSRVHLYQSVERAQICYYYYYIFLINKFHGISNLFILC